MQGLDRLPAPFHDVPDTYLSGPIGLAVSGGSDSLALMHLAARWAATSRQSLLVLTVDHGLRPEAAAEADAVARAAKRLGLSHRTLRWTSPVARQSAARRARHALLAGAVREAGGRLLLTGHTADDQAETVLMRARQGSGWYGLAGMRRLALSPVWPEGEGVWLFRPLIGETRAGLRGLLQAGGAAWIDDPSNANPAFERVRVRRLLAASPGLRSRVLALQSRFALLRAVEDAALARWLPETAGSADGTSLALRGTDLPPERLARGLSLLVQAVSGAEMPPRGDRLAALADRLTAPEGFRGATLGGVRFRPKAGRILLSAEAGRAQTAPAPAAIRSRLEAFRRLLINSAQEIAAGSGKESFLRDLAPILPEAEPPSLRDLT